MDKDPSGWEKTLVFIKLMGPPKEEWPPGKGKGGRRKRADPEEEEGRKGSLIGILLVGENLFGHKRFHIPL